MGKRRFLLVYGSETGQSQAIAEEIHELAPKHNLHSDIFCLSMTEKKFSLPKETCMVIVVSTTGEGECPETAQKFWRRLRKTTLEPGHLTHLNYALLALGDSNYNNFCKNGKNFDERFQQLGAKHFYPTGYADDAVGLEVVVEPWIEGLWDSLHKVLDSEAEQNNSTTTLQNGSPETLLSGNVQDNDNGSRTVQNCSESLAAENRNLQNLTLTDSSRRTQSKKTGEQSESSSNSNKSDGVNSKQSAMPLSNGHIPISNACSTSNNSIPAGDSNSSPPSTKTSSLETDVTLTDGGLGRPAVASLTCSIPPLSESGLTLPVLPPPYLKVEYSTGETVDLANLPIQGGASLPSASSNVIQASIIMATKLTSDDAVKTALDIELRVPESSVTFQPGDSFSIVCPNNASEVNDLLTRLGVEEKSDVPLGISVLEGTKKRKAAVPEFVPALSTLRHIFTTCCDIRALPKKAMLRTLVEHTNDPGEKRRLQELCSKQGQADYAAFLRAPGLSLLDVLRAFPSCTPPVERILEHLTRLLPRPYSISSSPLSSSDSFHFVFNIIDIPGGEGRSYPRLGVCTGWLSRLATAGGQDQGSDRLIIQNVEDKLKELSLADPTQKMQVPIFTRINQRFHLPSDPTKPLVMIGPGTGVAPFIGFLEHRGHLMRRVAEGLADEEVVTFGPTWLFFGCRHRENDFLYREKLEEFVETGVLSHLCVSFSRDVQSKDERSDGAPRYVRDNMRLHKEELASLMLEQGACVYVCGDAKNMAKNVLECWKDILKEKTGQSDFEMLQAIAKLREEKRYLEDVWT